MGYGSGFNRSLLMTLKTPLLAPTPMAMVSNVTVVNIGEAHLPAHNLPDISDKGHVSTSRHFEALK